LDLPDNVVRLLKSTNNKRGTYHTRRNWQYTYKIVRWKCFHNSSVQGRFGHNLMCTTLRETTWW